MLVKKKDAKKSYWVLHVQFHVSVDVKKKDAKKSYWVLHVQFHVSVKNVMRNTSSMRTYIHIIKHFIALQNVCRVDITIFLWLLKSTTHGRGI